MKTRSLKVGDYIYIKDVKSSFIGKITRVESFPLSEKYTVKILNNDKVDTIWFEKGSCIYWNSKYIRKKDIGVEMI